MVVPLQLALRQVWILSADIKDDSAEAAVARRRLGSLFSDIGTRVVQFLFERIGIDLFGDELRANALRVAGIDTGEQSDDNDALGQENGCGIAHRSLLQAAITKKA
jgi:hypothetical protein